MNENIQQRINQINLPAKNSVTNSALKASKSHFNNDSLSKSIRNEKEADIFIAELNAVVNLAKSRKA